MKELNASPGRVIQIGYEGEDKVTKIVFRYDEDWLACGDGVFKVRVLRHGDAEAYNATEVIDDRTAMTLTMTITDIELSVKGHGEMQVVYIGADFVKKSPIYRYNVSRAIDSEVVDPPEGSIIAEVEESLAEIKDDIGSLSELTTTDKSSLVSAINEVNAKESGKTIDVDAELSGTSENPVQNKVISDALAGKADKTYVDSALSDKANTADVNTALSTKANTSDVNTALSGKADKSYVDTELSSKADSSDIETALASKANTSDVNSALALKANSADMQTALAGKASTEVVTQSANGLMSSTDKTKLDTVYADYSSALTALGVI